MIYDVLVPLFNMQHLFGVYTPEAQVVILDRHLNDTLRCAGHAAHAEHAVRALGAPRGLCCRCHFCSSRGACMGVMALALLVIGHSSYLTSTLPLVVGPPPWDCAVLKLPVLKPVLKLPIWPAGGAGGGGAAARWRGAKLMRPYGRAGQA